MKSNSNNSKNLKIKFLIYQYMLLTILVSASLSASDTILSSTQNEILNLNRQKTKADVSKLSKDWIDKNAITYTYGYSKTNDSRVPSQRSSTISINQSIFRSGGIYYAIKYASNVDDESKLSLKIQKQNLITQVLNSVFSIKKLDLQIRKQKLSFQNAIIDYENKKESVFNGLLDISFLNNALLVKNKIEISLIDLEFAKQNIIRTLSTLSDLPYNKIKLPSLQLITKDKFSNNNLNIKKASISMQKQNSLSGVLNAQYLPKVKVNYSKILNHTKHNDSYKYGFNIIVPIDYKTLDALQSNKIAVLKQKALVKLIEEQEEVFFKLNEFEIKNIIKKIALTKQNIKAYKKLLTQTQELFNEGLKTSNDVKILYNSKKSEELSIKIYQIDKQMKLLDIYKRVIND
jgi:hypothetical protein